jgi:hypothetical protein
MQVEGPKESLGICGIDIPFLSYVTASEVITMQWEVRVRKRLEDFWRTEKGLNEVQGWSSIYR